MTTTQDPGHPVPDLVGEWHDTATPEDLVKAPDDPADAETYIGPLLEDRDR